MTEPAQKSKRSRAKTAGIVIGIIFGVLVGGALVFNGLMANNIINIPNMELPTSITYSGKASTDGLGTHATQVIFIESDSNERRTASVNNGNYDIILPNGRYSWDIYIGWQGALGSSGTCNSGASVSYDNIYTSQSIDIRC
jgi:hypothetical protein